MSDDQIGPIVLALLVLLSAAHLLGHLFARLRQPRVIGEIAAGILLGPTRERGPVFLPACLMVPTTHSATFWDSSMRWDCCC